MRRRNEVSLVRHDRMIVVNELRSVLSSWPDRLVAVCLLLGLLAGMRSSLSGLRWPYDAWVAVGFGAICGSIATQRIRRRLEFHRHDGVLPAAALERGSRRGYAATLHALVLGCVAISALAVRHDLLIFALAGYLAGAGSSDVADRAIAVRGARSQRSVARSFMAWSHAPWAGLVAAAFVLASSRLVGSGDAGTQTLVVGSTSAIAVACLTTLDAAAIGFMTIAGYGGWAIVGLRARGALIFVAAVVPTWVLLSEPIDAAVVGAIAAAALALMAARILAYRIHAKRVADIVVGIAAALVVVTGVAAPMLLPAVVLAVLWHFHRHSARTTWSIA